MKKLIYSLVFIFGSSLAVKAQVAQGSLFLGGGLGFNSTGGETTTSVTGGTTTTVESPKTNTIFFSPTVGYFLTDKIAAGVMLNFRKATTKTSSTPTSESQSSTFGVGVFARYYASINDQFYFWPQLDLGIGSGKSESTSGGITTDGPDIKEFGVGITPGFSFFPSTRYGFDFSVGRLGISNTKTTSISTGTPAVETEVEDADFDFFWDMSRINIGMTIFFGGGE